MNILIKNWHNKCNPAEVSAMIKVYTAPEHYKRLQPDVPIIVADKRLKGPTVIVTKQGNGNLCFEFKNDGE